MLLIPCKLIYSQTFIKNIETAFREGNAKKLAVYFDKYLDLSFSEKSNTYSKKQAEVIVQKFFTKVEPRLFNKINKGSSQINNTDYYVGSLETANGTYQVYMFFAIRNSVYYMKELRFEKDAP